MNELNCLGLIMTTKYLQWPDDKAKICDQVRGDKRFLKLVTKVKNEGESLQDWLEFHTDAAQNYGIIIFDNGSTDELTWELYEQYRDHIQVFNFGVNHNLIHDVSVFSELYSSLRDSSDFYAFIDADEFVYFTDGVICTKKPLLNSSLPLDGSVYFGFWAINYPGNKDIFYISDVGNRFSASLKGGKPLLHSSVNIRGFVNHNVQLSEYMPEVIPRGGVIICHMTKLNKERRIKINRQKIMAHKLIETDKEIDEVLKSGNIFGYEGPLLTYLKEIIECQKTDWKELYSPPPGCFKIGVDGRIIYADKSAKEQMFEFVESCQNVWLRIKNPL